MTRCMSCRPWDRSWTLHSSRLWPWRRVQSTVGVSVLRGTASGDKDERRLSERGASAQGPRAKEVKPATVNRELNIVRGCFSRAVDWGRLGSSPMKGVKLYKVDNVRTRVLSREEIETLLSACPRDLRLIARATLESLFRLSEVLTLKREDIGATFVTVIRIKGGRMLKVPITSELRSELLARAHPSGFVFGENRYDGTPPTQAAVTVAFGRLMRKIGLPAVSHHVLRHTGASAMVAAGVSLRVVQEIGGWTSLRMLERYTHPTGEEMQRAVRVLSDQTTAQNRHSGRSGRPSR